MKYKVKVTRVCRVEFEAWTEVEAENLSDAQDKAYEPDLCSLDWTEVHTETQNVEYKVWPA